VNDIYDVHSNDCKNTLQNLIVQVFVMLFLVSRAARNGLWGHARDSFTKAVVHSVKITLMTRDSTLIDSCTAQTHEGMGRVGGDAWYHFVLPAVPQHLIIRASHPDYEEVTVTVRLP